MIAARYLAEVAGRSSFGTVKKTASGRYRAFYTVSGVTHSAGRTFPNKTQADSWLKSEWDRRRSGTWVERRPSTTLRSFVDEQWWPWMTHLAERTADHYRPDPAHGWPAESASETTTPAPSSPRRGGPAGSSR